MPGRPHVSGAGVGLGLLAGASFGTTGVWSSSLIQSGWSPGAVAVTRLGGAALLLTMPALAAVRRSPGSLRLDRRITALGVVGIGACLLCHINAIAHLSVGLALLLEYLGVLLVVLWTWLHGHRPGLRTAAGGGLALAGLVLAVDVLGGASVDVEGLLWGLGSMVGAAFYYVLSAAGRGTQAVVSAWTGAVVATLALAAAALVGVIPLRATAAKVTLLDEQVSWLLPALAMPLVSSALAMSVGMAAAHRLGARVASFLGLSEVVFGCAFAWLVVGQSLTPVQCLGCAAVVVGVAMAGADQRLAGDNM